MPDFNSMTTAQVIELANESGKIIAGAVIAIAVIVLGLWGNNSVRKYNRRRGR